MPAKKSPARSARKNTRTSYEPSIHFSSLRNNFFLGLIIGFSIFTLFVLRPFFYPLFWAAIIAIMFFPLYKKLQGSIQNASLAATLMLCIVFAVIVLPVALLSVLIINQSTELFALMSQSKIEEGIANILSLTSHPLLLPISEKLLSDWPTYVATATKSMTAYLVTGAKTVTSGSATFVFLFVIMFYTLFYFFKDGERMLKRLMFLLPLGSEYEQMLYDRFTSVARATIKGTLILGAIQGFLGGVLFAVTGIQGAIIWGVIMMLLSIIPAIGSFIIWMPAGLIMLAMGNTWQGVLILVFGSVVISNIDNLLRPPLIGRDVSMHPLLVLLSTLGGLMLFGISGFIIGPIVLALHLAVMNIYTHHYKRQLTKD